MANDFTGDSSCKALWRFEPGALYEDSIGNNDLVLTIGSGTAPTSATSEYKEGSGSIKMVSDYGIPGITDANLDAGFPLKSGDTAKIISVAGWMKRPAASPLVQPISLIRKCNLTGNTDATIRLGFDYTDDDMCVLIEAWRTSAQSNFQSIKLGAGVMANDKWYHVGFAIDGVGKTYLVRLYDATADTAYTYSGVLDSELYINTGPLLIGYLSRGWWDEIVVFAELKTTDDFDAIRAGTFGEEPENSYTKSGWRDYAPVRTYVSIPAMEHGWTDCAPTTIEINGAECWAWTMTPPAPRWLLPSTQPRREVFICTLRKTGLSDVEVPLASLQMRRRDGNPTMISCVIPDAETYLDYAKDRKNGEIIIYAGSITEDGTRHLSELERVSLDSISYDIGVRSSSLVISGYRTETNINPRPVDIEGVTYYGLQADGKRRIRAKINQFLRPGDTAIYGDGSFVVDQIYVFIEPKNAWMEAAGL
jgi:hypothetical protein